MPDFDPIASKKRGEPVWSLREWRKHYRLSGPMKAIEKRCKWATIGVPSEESMRVHRTIPLYISRVICVGCKGEGTHHDPLIVGCKKYDCPLWPYRKGEDPAKSRGSRETPHGRRFGETANIEENRAVKPTPLGSDSTEI